MKVSSRKFIKIAIALNPYFGYVFQTQDTPLNNMKF